MNNHINESALFPGYSYRQTGVFTYDWYKDGNKLGGKKASEMTLKLNKLIIDGMKAISEG